MAETTTLDPTLANGSSVEDNPAAGSPGQGSDGHTGETSPGDLTELRTLVTRLQQQVSGSQQEFHRQREEQQRREAEWQRREMEYQQRLQDLQQRREAPAVETAPPVSQAIQEAIDRGDPAPLATYLQRLEQAQQQQLKTLEQQQQERWRQQERQFQDSQALGTLQQRYAAILADPAQTQAVATIYQDLLNDPAVGPYYDLREGQPGVIRQGAQVYSLPLLAQAARIHTERQQRAASPPASEPVTVSGGSTRPQQTRASEPGPLFTAQERATRQYFQDRGAFKDERGQRYANLEAALAAEWKRLKDTNDPKYQQRVQAWRQGQWHG